MKHHSSFLCLIQHHLLCVPFTPMCQSITSPLCISSLNLTISRKKHTERSVTKEQSSQHTTKCCDKSGIWMPWLQIHFRGVNRKSGFCYVRTVLLLGQCDKLAVVQSTVRKRTKQRGMFYLLSLPQILLKHAILTKCKCFCICSATKSLFTKFGF